MSLKALAAKILAKRIHAKTQKWANNPIETQQEVFQELIKEATQTKFGKEHNFSAIKNHPDFTKNVPVRDYEGLKSFGKENLCILLKPQEPLRVQNIFRLPQHLCHFIFKPLETQF